MTEAINLNSGSCPWFHANKNCLVTVVALLAIASAVTGSLGLARILDFSNEINIAFLATGGACLLAALFLACIHKKEATKELPQEECWVSESSGKTQFTYGGHSACTPLAVLFATHQGPVNITSLLEDFSQKAPTLNFTSGKNYTAEESIAMIGRMKAKTLEVEETWSLTANESAPGLGFRGSDVISPAKTWKEIISDLKPKQGAVIQFAGYTLSCRRLNDCWEFFDSHNGRDLSNVPEFASFKIQPGAYIRRCLSQKSATDYLRVMFKHGPAGAGLADDLSNAVEITILK